MRIQSPSSHAHIRVRISPIDAALAAVSPLIALYLRDAYILAPTWDNIALVAGYCLVSLAASLLVFVVFDLEGVIPAYLSVHDLLNVAKAVIAGELITAFVIFSFNRLEGIPRSTPAIHALILAVGLLGARAVARHKNRRAAEFPQSPSEATEHIILVGLNELTALYLKFIETCARGRLRVIALLANDPALVGRSVNGVRVFGTPANLESLVEEFDVHGVHTDRIVVCGQPTLLAKEVLAEVEQLCARRSIALMFLPQLLGSDLVPPLGRVETVPGAATLGGMGLQFRRSPYRAWGKRLLDLVLVFGLALPLMPLFGLALLLASFDVGSPVFFWQQRLGLNGRNFLLYKIRSLRSVYDWQGHRVEEERRLSWAGRLLRKTRLDELPQLLNVLVGDMSLIGPRPLLPIDQPPFPAVRLMVRPGITGWAQVNGTNLLSPAEKEELDGWYIRNVSLLLDLRILFRTAVVLICGERKSERALALARAQGTETSPPAHGAPKRHPFVADAPN